MKIYTSNFRHHWVSPYTILEKVCFWEKDNDVFYDHEDTGKGKYVWWVKFLDPFCTAWMKFLDFVHPRINYVKIDRWDTWNFDETLAQIILPGLKQLKAETQGVFIVDSEDVPEHLRFNTKEQWDRQMSFDFYNEESVYREEDNFNILRYNWVLDEMIFAFEHLNNKNWDEQFCTGVADWQHVPCKWDENGKAILYSMVKGPNHTYEIDYDGIRAVSARINNGLRLFGKYYQGLWS